MEEKLRRLRTYHKVFDKVSYKISQKYSIIKIDCPLLQKEFIAEKISPKILGKLATDAEKYSGESMKVVKILNERLQKKRVFIFLLKV